MLLSVKPGRPRGRRDRVFSRRIARFLRMFVVRIKALVSPRDSEGRDGTRRGRIGDTERTRELFSLQFVYLRGPLSASLFLFLTHSSLCSLSLSLSLSSSSFSRAAARSSSAILFVSPRREIFRRIPAYRVPQRFRLPQSIALRPLLEPARRAITNA